MYGHKRLTILPAESRIGVPICVRCWRFGHRPVVCPFKSQLCTHCASPHEAEHHRVLAACCKAQPKATPPRQATPAGHPCPHPARCVNCGLAHSSDSHECSFWKNRYNAKWLYSKYSEQKVGDELLRYIPTPNSPFPSVTGSRLFRRNENAREIRPQVD